MTDPADTRNQVALPSPGKDLGQIAWWCRNIDELDREIARLCLICQVRILDPGVIERVLAKDASVCQSANAGAFARLHALLMMYFALRRKSVDAVGELRTEQIEKRAIDALRSRFGSLLGQWPPG